MKTIVLKKFFHREENRIGIYFPIDTEITRLVRKLPDCQWSNTHKCWHVPEKQDKVGEICQLFEGVAQVQCPEEKVAESKITSQIPATEIQHSLDQFRRYAQGVKTVLKPD